MKRNLTAQVVLTVWLLAGCAGVDPGHDPVVVNAERAIASSFETVNTFLKLEYQNRDAWRLLNKDIYTTAEYLRKNFGNWYASAVRVKMAYKQNRTPENKAELETYVALLTQALGEAQQYLALTAKATVRPP